MSPVAIDHEHSSPKCHHCHITSPIPLDQLIKTHPLRSVVAKQENDKENVKEAQPVLTEANTKTEKKENLIQSLLEEVANHKFKLKKEKSTTVSESGSAINSLEESESPKLVRPVHSYLHHVSDKSVYKNAEKPSAHNQETSFDTPSSSFKKTDYSPSVDASSSIHSPDLIINAKALDSQISSLEKQSKYNILSEENQIKSNHLTLKDSETQTSRASSVSRVTYNKVRDCISEVSSISVANHRHKSKKKCNIFLCNLPSGLLFAGYGLLIVIGIVVAVALSQRERQIAVQSSALPGRPNFLGATRPAQGRIVLREKAPRLSRPQGRRVIRPRVEPHQNVIAAPAPIQSRAPPPQVLFDEDLDYFSDAALNDADFLLPARPQAVRPQQTRPQQAFRPVEIKPQFQAQAPRPVSPPRQKAPRKGTPTAFRQEFNLQPQTQEEHSRGQKEPEVQIIKSWSNRNADGTFSWGYINTDGSFKNETKGTDCVVRGIYGYIDQDTGETVSFSYESGNPCDPDAPDYYYDYDDGTLNVGGQAIPRKQVGSNLSARRRP